MKFFDRKLKIEIVSPQAIDESASLAHHLTHEQAVILFSKL